MEADILPHLSLFPRKAFTAHVSEERGKNVMVLFIATVAILKKKRERKENLSFSPLSTHPSSTETMTGQCGCPFSVCCGPPPLPNSSHHLLTRPSI